MTNTRLCTECATRITSSNRARGRDYPDVCNRCYDYWGWENAHSDGDHDSLPVDADERIGCLVCLDAKPVARTGHTNTANHSRTSHAACDHERTPADRAACRKLRKRNA
jgi:hypothetical protein